MKKLTEKNLAWLQDAPVHGKRKNITITPLGLKLCRMQYEKDMWFIKNVVKQLEGKYFPEQMMYILPALCDTLSLLK